MLERLRSRIDAYREELASLTADLVAIDTENPPGRGYRRCLDKLGESLTKLGFPHRIDVVPGSDADSEYARYWLRSQLGAGEPTVYFHGHVDVVPADDPAQFQPRITEDTVFGRGTTDMKGGIVSMIYAMKALDDLSVPLAGRIALQIVPDEETGGALGSQALTARDLLVDEGALAMLTAEPTGGLVWHASRGAITCRVTVEGRPSHVGLQYRGVNAFEHMLTIAGAVRALKTEVEARETGFALEPRAARRSILLMGGEAEGGRNFNVVPDRFSFTIDRRINPEEDFDDEKSRLLEVIANATPKGVDVNVDVFQQARPSGVSVEHGSARTLDRAIADVRGERARFELCPGILETRFYAERNVPSFAYGPGLLSVAHGPKEFVKRRDLEEVTAVYALTAARLLSADVG